MLSTIFPGPTRELFGGLYGPLHQAQPKKVLKRQNCIVRIRVLNLPCHGAILHQANKNTEPDYLIMLAGGKTNHPQLKNSIVWTVQNAQFSITIEDEFET